MRHALLLCALLGAGCSKKAEPARRTEPWLATPSATSASATNATGPLRFRVLPESQIRFTMPTRRARASGSVAIEKGSIELDPRDLSRTKASLDFDLTRLAIDADSLPQGVELGGAEPRLLALQWLELGGDVPAERRQQFATAHFELSALEDISGALDLDSNKPNAQSSATVVGSLLLHGFRAPLRTRVSLRPHKPAVAGAPRRLSIRSVEPVVLSLAAHDIQARSASGVNDAALTARASEVVGKSARVEFELIAEAESTSVK